jgi:hypothetical protein
LLTRGVELEAQYSVPVTAQLWPAGVSTAAMNSLRSTCSTQPESDTVGTPAAVAG